jgi:ABC-2 type transport system permease protein
MNTDVSSLVAITIMEWRKATSLRILSVLGLVSVGVSAVLALFYTWVVLQVHLETPASAVEATAVTTSKAAVTALVAGVVGVLVVASDRRGGGLAVSATIEPRRARIVAAKAVVAAVIGATVGCLGLATNALVAALRLTPHDLFLTDVSSWALLVAGAVAVHVGWAALGVAVGLAIRAMPAAVLAIVGGPWLVERVIGVARASSAPEDVMGVLDRINPFAAADGLQNPLVIVEPVVEVVGSGTSVGILGSAAVFAAFVALALWLAGRTFVRADLFGE